jgi:hypothetical protein
VSVGHAPLDLLREMTGVRPTGRAQAYQCNETDLLIGDIENGEK